MHLVQIISLGATEIVLVNNLTVMGDHHRLNVAKITVFDLAAEVIEGLCVETGTKEQGREQEESFHVDMIINLAETRCSAYPGF